MASIVELSEILALGWLILQLGGSAWDVALLGFARTVPLFGLSLLAGAVGDMVDRRRIIAGVHLVNSVVAALFLATLVLGAEEPWHLFVVTAIKGATRAFDHTSRRAMVFGVVGPVHMVGALSLDTLGFSSGKVVGPLITGALLEVAGDAVAAFGFLLVLQVLSFILALLLKTPSMPAPTQGQNMLSRIVEGLSYARSSQAVSAVLLLSVVMNLIFRYNLLIPVVAQSVLDIGPAQMGLLAAADGMGTVLGVSFITLQGGVRYHGRIFLAGCFGVTVFLLVFALSHSYPLSFMMLIGFGAFQVGFSTMQVAILLMASPSTMHGRVLGAQTLAVGAGQVGSVEMGALASELGVSLALLLNAVAAMAIVVLVGAFMPALRRPTESVGEEAVMPSVAPASEASGT